MIFEINQITVFQSKAATTIVNLCIIIGVCYTKLLYPIRVGAILWNYIGAPNNHVSKISKAEQV